jgi:hypothetical protein
MVLKDEGNKIEEEEINTALKRVLILLDQLMTCQNLQNKLLNIIVLFIWYLLASLKQMSPNMASTCFSPLAILTSV